MEHSKEAFTLSEFITRYSTSRATVYREMNAGRLKATKLGRRTLIAKAEAERWFADLPKA